MANVKNELESIIYRKCPLLDPAKIQHLAQDILDAGFVRITDVKIDEDELGRIIGNYLNGFSIDEIGLVKGVDLIKAIASAKLIKIKKKNKMRIAKDGLPFDVDQIGELKDGEVEIIQFLRPDGRRRRMATFLGKDIAKIAENQILSAEQLTTREIAMYSRLVGEPKEKEINGIAQNCEGENSPNNVLIKLIKRKGGK